MTILKFVKRWLFIVKLWSMAAVIYLRLCTPFFKINLPYFYDIWIHFLFFFLSYVYGLHALECANPSILSFFIWYMILDYLIEWHILPQRQSELLTARYNPINLSKQACSQVWIWMGGTFWEKVKFFSLTYF